MSAYLYIVIMMIHSVNKKNRYRVLYSYVSKQTKRAIFTSYLYIPS